MRVDECREHDGRRSARRQRGKAEKAPEGREAAVGDEVRNLVAPRAAAPEEADGEHGGEVRAEECEREGLHAGERRVERRRHARSRALATSRAAASSSVVPTASARSSIANSGEWCGRWGPSGAQPTKKKQPGTRSR